MKTRAIMRITGALLVTLLNGLKSGVQARAFRVVRRGLPEDVELVSAFVDHATHDVLVVLSSAHFEIAADALIHDSGYPYLEPVVMTVDYSWVE